MSSVGSALTGAAVASNVGSQSVDKSPGGSSSGLSIAGAVPPVFAQQAQQPGGVSTCVEPDHRELIRSVGTVLHRRVRDNETVEEKIILPLFCEDTHTTPEPKELYEVSMPLLHLQMVSFPTLFTLSKLPPPKAVPKTYEVPDARTVATFIENIRQKARLTPQALVVTLIYIDRLEARSEGVLLHARSWRPLVFASLLLASKVWHDISYWNSDFQSICPIFNVRNINKMERAILQLLQYNTIISASQYASYYFSLRHTVRAPAEYARRPGEETENEAEVGAATSGVPAPAAAAAAAALGANSPERGSHGTPLGLESANTPSSLTDDNFRSKYFMAIAVAGSSRLQEQSAAVANQQGSSSQLSQLEVGGGGAASSAHTQLSSELDRHQHQRQEPQDLDDVTNHGWGLPPLKTVSLQPGAGQELFARDRRPSLPPGVGGQQGMLAQELAASQAPQKPPAQKQQAPAPAPEADDGWQLFPRDGMASSL